uniref:Transmembrane protein n=1 Tax=Acrobeloides nanus TaxID=290746 RepID=A0A914DI01_9BILA
MKTLAIFYLLSTVGNILSQNLQQSYYENVVLRNIIRQLLSGEEINENQNIPSIYPNAPLINQDYGRGLNPNIASNDGIGNYNEPYINNNQQFVPTIGEGSQINFQGINRNVPLIEGANPNFQQPVDGSYTNTFQNQQILQGIRAGIIPESLAPQENNQFLSTQLLNGNYRFPNNNNFYSESINPNIASYLQNLQAKGLLNQNSMNGLYNGQMNPAYLQELQARGLFNGDGSSLGINEGNYCSRVACDETNPFYYYQCYNGKQCCFYFHRWVIALLIIIGALLLIFLIVYILRFICACCCVRKEHEYRNDREFRKY